jgi:hypothetical protein
VSRDPVATAPGTDSIIIVNPNLRAPNKKANPSMLEFASSPKTKQVYLPLPALNAAHEPAPFQVHLRTAPKDLGLYDVSACLVN